MAQLRQADRESLPDFLALSPSYGLLFLLLFSSFSILCLLLFQQKCEEPECQVLVVLGFAVEFAEEDEDQPHDLYGNQTIV
jgi:hypothetical protein